MFKPIKKNRWRTAFFALLIIVVAVPIFLFGLLTGGLSSNSVTPGGLQPGSKNAAIFTVKANKQQLETLINDQIRSNKNSRLTYQVSIGNQVALNGRYRLLFTGIPFSLTFNPVVSNGDILLKESEVKLGSIKLPDQQVLSFLKAGSKFPKWVVIQPDKRQVYINLTSVKIQNGMYLRAKTIDLPKNDVSFTVHRGN